MAAMGTDTVWSVRWSRREDEENEELREEEGEEERDMGDKKGGWRLTVGYQEKKESG